MLSAVTADTYRRAVVNKGGKRRPPVYIVPPNTIKGLQVAQVEANITGTVWRIEVAVGDTVQEGDTVVILESMKMEMPIEAEDDGTVAEIRCSEGQAVSEGDVLVVLA
jgi:acetyl-CoA carboxylase biotin carboxyl carrier protein